MGNPWSKPESKLNDTQCSDQNEQPDTENVMRMLRNLEYAMIIHSSDSASYGIETIGITRLDEIISIYIVQSSRIYNMNIPTDIIQLCRLFCNSTKWIINPKENITQRITFEISSNCNKCLYYEISAQFECGPYVSSLTIRTVRTRKTPDALIFNFRKMFLYTHICCDALNFERKCTKTLAESVDKQSFGFGKIPTELFTFNLYFQLLPPHENKGKYILKQHIPLNKWYIYKWKLKKHTIESIWNNTEKGFWFSQFSPNFYNQGCFCMSIHDVRLKEYDEQRIRIRMHVLRHPFRDERSISITRRYKICCVDGKCYETDIFSSNVYMKGSYHINNLEEDIAILRNDVINEIEIVFTFKTFKCIE